MNNLIDLSKVANNGIMQTPEACLRECLDNRIGKQGAFKEGKKLIVIALDDTGEGYDISWGRAGLKAAEMISLVDIFKTEIKKMMGY